MNFEAVAAPVFIAIGSGVLVWSARNFVVALLSRRWPEARGTVIASNLDRSKDTDGPLYRPEVRYRYAVSGKDFEASRAYFGDRLGLSWSGPAARLLRRYPPGAAITVRYDPKDPADAVLESGLNGFVLAGIAFGGVFVLFGLLALRSV